MYHSEAITKFFIENLMIFFRKSLKENFRTGLDFEKIANSNATTKERGEYFEAGKTIFIDLGLLMVIPAIIGAVLSITLISEVNIFTFLSFLLYLLPLCIGLSFGFKVKKNTQEKEKYTRKNLIRSVITSIVFAFISSYLLASGLEP